MERISSLGGFGKTGYHKDFANNVPIEFFQFFRGNPELQMLLSAHFLHSEAVEISFFNFKFQNVADKA